MMTMKIYVAKWSTIMWSFSRPAVRRRFVHMSSIYRPVNVTPPPGKMSEQATKRKKEKENETQDLHSKSLKLLVNNGLIKPSSCFGAFHFLPIGLKAMEKLMLVIDNYMGLGGCQKIQMPTLTSSVLWRTTGRLEECNPELMRIKDRHSKEYLLSPTHEEAVCDLIKNTPVSYRQLPLKLYQMTEKFRDEMRPRYGLMRGRQFLMKDLYTFDVNLEAAKGTYKEINGLYQKILNALDVKWVQARGSTGSIGGIMSHEFHILSDIGEDKLLRCSSCNESFNQDLSIASDEETELVSSGGGQTVIVQTSSTVPKCINCGSSSLSTSTSIEVGHAFLLGTKYTKPLESMYSSESNQKVLMEMGCYGLGVSRLLAAALEVLSSDAEIRWPLRIAPYLVSIIPPKEGSKEEPFGAKVAQTLYESLKKILPNDVIYDDRLNQTIGKRFLDNKKLGIPFIVVVGKAVHDPSGPILEFNDVNLGSSSLEQADKIVKLLYDVRTKIKDMR